MTDDQEPLSVNDQEDVMPSAAENVQEEDVLVEENVTPFFMNSGKDCNGVVCVRNNSCFCFSGENFQQTLHRLGIEIPQNILNEHHF